MTKTIHSHKYPPFPEAPAGESVTPFSDFKERGIQVQLLGDNIEELDGAGQPTVALPYRHNTDRSKTEGRPKPYRPPEVTIQKPDGTLVTRRREWWEDFEYNDLVRGNMCYNPNEARSDRFHKATGDFNRNRRWPPKFTTVREQWDQFQLFAGLLTSIPIWQKKRAREDETGSSDADSDFDDDEEDEKTSLKKAKKIDVAKVDFSSLDQDDVDASKPGKKHPRPHEPYGADAKGFRRPTIVENDDEIKDLITRAKEEKDDKLVDFLNDPETKVKIYLSSYFRAQGFHQADRNLFIHPKLLVIFFSYILRHRVLPDKEEEEGIQKAREVAELALKELPLTAKLAKTVPGDFNRAMTAFFDIKQYSNFWGSSELTAPTNKEDAQMQKAEDGGEAPTDLQVVDNEVIVEEERKEKALFDELVNRGSLKVLGEGAGIADTSRGVSTVDENALDARPQGSGLSDSIWASASNDTQTTTNGWDSGTSAEVDPWALADQNGPAETLQTQWASEDPPLYPWLGRDTFPTTHKTGIIEWSVRRIKEVIQPDSGKTPSLYVKGETVDGSERNYDSAQAVESELSRQLYKVKMEPWLGWGDSSRESEGTMPRILEGSQGQVLIQPGMYFEGDTKKKVGVDASGMDVGSARGYTSTTGLKPFNSIEDTITVLLDTPAAEHLRVGMGLGGTWVQLLRNGDMIEDVATVSPTKKQKGVGLASNERFWYIDGGLQLTLTSYHTVAV